METTEYSLPHLVCTSGSPSDFQSGSRLRASRTSSYASRSYRAHLPQSHERGAEDIEAVAWRLAQDSGGRVFVTPDSEELGQAKQLIAKKDQGITREDGLREYVRCRR